MFKPLVNSAQLANYFVKIADGQNRFLPLQWLFYFDFYVNDCVAEASSYSVA